jgi:hypothetical protein
MRRRRKWQHAGRAVKQFIIAANFGYDKALDAVRENFVDGFISKELDTSPV